MKRYSMGFFKGAPAMFEQPDGDYVQVADVVAALKKPDGGWTLNTLLYRVEDLRKALSRRIPGVDGKTNGGPA